MKDPLPPQENDLRAALHQARAELQQVKAELHWKSAFLEAQANASIDGILVVDQQGKKILQNQQTIALFKIPPGIARDENDAHQRAWVRDATMNPEQFMEKVIYLNAHPDEISRDEIELKNGTLLDRYSAPVYGQEGKYYGRIWTFRDITERRREEAVVRDSKRFLQSTLDALSSHIAILDEHGTIVEVNAAWQSFARANQFSGGHWGVGVNYLQLCDAASGACSAEAAAVAAGIRSVMAGRPDEFHLEYPCHSPQEQRWFIVRVTRFGGPGPVRVVVAHENITERKQAENAVRASDEKFRQLADHITDAFWIRSPDLREVHYLSPAFEQIWGRPVARLYANPQQWADFILPEDRDRVLAAFAALTGNAPSLDLEYRIVRPNGEIRWIRVRGFQVRDAANNLIRHAGIVTDITERKRVEAQLLQAQKLETIGKLAGGIAHEFNSIMTVIIGQSELLLSDLPAGDELRQNATEIRKAADRAATLTRQLLAYGRKQILQPEILDLNLVLTSLSGMIRHLLGSAVDMQLVADRGIKSVKVDAGQLELVIVNIVMNAADAMPHGGRLTLETARLTLDQNYVGQFPDLKAGDYVLLAITDTGTGMREEVKARVFEPFFTTKAVGKGPGLGLSTCHGIIKQSGGHIAIYSEPGRGTTVKIYLPEVAAAPPGSFLPKPPRTAAGTETILLVEDDPALREMAAQLLGRLGYRVLPAGDGRAALRLAQQPDTGRVDLLFTDVVMPLLSGPELARQVRSLFPATKILFTSAYTEGAIVHQGVLDPGVEFLLKPFTPAALAEKVRALLDQPPLAVPEAAQGTFGFTKNQMG